MSLIRLLPERRFIPDCVYSWLGYRYLDLDARMTVSEQTLDTVYAVFDLVAPGSWSGSWDSSGRANFGCVGWCRDPWLFEQRVRNALETATGGEVVTSVG